MGKLGMKGACCKAGSLTSVTSQPSFRPMPRGHACYLGFPRAAFNPSAYGIVLTGLAQWCVACGGLAAR